MDDIAGKVDESLQAFFKANPMLPKKRWKDLLRSSQGPIGPAALLLLEARNCGGDLGGTVEVFQIDDPVTQQLHAVTEIKVLGERVGLPASSFQDGLFPEHATAAVEVLEKAVSITAGLFNDEMDVDGDRIAAR